MVVASAFVGTYLTSAYKAHLTHFASSGVYVPPKPCQQAPDVPVFETFSTVPVFLRFVVIGQSD